jgi:hypothetical protein
MPTDKVGLSPTHGDSRAIRRSALLRRRPVGKGRSTAPSSTKATVRTDPPPAMSQRLRDPTHRCCEVPRSSPSSLRCEPSPRALYYNNSTMIKEVSIKDMKYKVLPYDVLLLPSCQIKNVTSTKKFSQH